MINTKQTFFHQNALDAKYSGVTISATKDVLGSRY